MVKVTFQKVWYRSDDVELRLFKRDIFSVLLTVAYGGHKKGCGGWMGNGWMGNGWVGHEYGENEMGSLVSGYLLSRDL